MNRYWVVWTGLLVLITVDFWVSSDDLGSPHNPLWDSNGQVKNNAEEATTVTVVTIENGEDRIRDCVCRATATVCQMNVTRIQESVWCAVAYYGNPLAERGSCQPCNCDHALVCDPLTGECDDCAVKLMDDLEEMDNEFLSLKNQLEPVRLNAALIAALKKLEDATAGTKVLVDKYSESVYTLKLKMKEFETDVENVKDDLNVLDDKAIQASCSAVQLLKTLDKTYQQGNNLRSDSVNLLRKILEFLEEQKHSNQTGGNTEEARRMLKEARQMLEEMRRQNCKVQRELAKDEHEKANSLFDLIMKNFMVPLNGSLILADRIGQNLMDLAPGIRDIQEALIDADLDVMKATVVNNDNEVQLENILKLLNVLEKERNKVTDNLNMTRGTLNNILDLQNIMEDLTTVTSFAKSNYFRKKSHEMSQLAAQVDGAKKHLNRKLDLLSQATAKAAIVRRAEEHAEDLMNLAMDFHMYVRVYVRSAMLNLTNLTAVQNAVETIKVFTDVIDAIRAAEAAANRAKESADKALKDVQGQDLQKKANDLKGHANSLLDDAKDAQIKLRGVAQKCEAHKDLIQQAEGKQNLLRQDMRDELEKLSNIKRDDIGALISEAKEVASDVNGTVSNALARIHNISEELNKTKISTQDPNLNNILNDVNKTLTELDQSFPSLIDKLQEVENQSEHASVPANMSSNLQRIKDLIEKTRDLANRVRGPIFFSGKSYIELRPPEDIEDLRAFTALNLTLHRPVPRGDGKRRRRQTDEGDNLFVLYLGNKHTFEDYIGLVVRDGVLFCVYKLGGFVHEIKTSEITKSSSESAFMDRVDFRRGSVQELGYYFDGTGYGKVNIKSTNIVINFDVLSHQMDAILFYMEKKWPLKANYFPTSDRKNPDQDDSEWANHVNTERRVHGYHLSRKCQGSLQRGLHRGYNIVLPSLKGCVNNIQVDISASFIEEVGIVPGCSDSLLGIREATFYFEGSLTATQTVEDKDLETMISFGFKTFRESGRLIYNGRMNNQYILYLDNGFVKVTYSDKILISKNKYEIGKWHYVSAYKDSSGPQFSLDVRTKSSDGLLFHIMGKQGVPVVILYMTDGKVKLSVGGDKIISSHKIHNGDWHNVRLENIVSKVIKFGLKRKSFYLAVDGIQTPDGRLLKGSIHDLRSPVYVGQGEFKTPFKTYVMVKVNDGRRNYGTTVTPARLLCSGFHYVTENSRKGVEVQMSYVGCLRNVLLNHVPVSFEEMTSVFGPINTNECPAE
ncbi:Laminin subunit alpha-3 [Triplophysa tibetana]|uniref:Laminin subunit alpha-3 n=1 Tax=Triplophysa tibetana TaxID=1572043 RepID=A0A5A9NTA6_9TELE|nr:Laminin subunit alpha-3 [Triplophysa tibetana]